MREERGGRWEEESKACGRCGAVDVVSAATEGSGVWDGPFRDERSASVSLTSLRAPEGQP